MRFKYRHLLKLLLIVGIGVNLWRGITAGPGEYFTRDYWDRFGELKRLYGDSQYARKDFTAFLPDEFINAYIGGAQIKGGNPILFAPDTPPLGRYLIGLSARLTGNENYVCLLAAAVSLWLLYLLGRQVFAHQTTALVVPLLVSFEPIFQNQLRYVPLLDIIQLPFLLAGFYFFNLGTAAKHKKLIFFALASAALGAFVSIKFFATGATVAAAWYAAILWRRKEKYFKTNFVSLSLVLPLSGMVLLGSYLKAFIDNPNWREFLGIQKWVFVYHKSQLVLPFSIWPLILFNRWHVWYGDQPIISDPQWQLTWPIVFVGTLATVALYIFKKIPKNRHIEVMLVWSVVYLLFFSFGQITARYLVIYLPVLYLITLYLFEAVLLKWGLVSSIKKKVLRDKGR